MEKNYGIRFSSETYATKEEVKLSLNMTNVDSIWEQINIYRSYYLVPLNLRNIERIPFNVCISPKLSRSFISNEKKLSKILTKYQIEKIKNEQAFNELNTFSYLSILTTLRDIYKINVDINLLTSLISDNTSSLPIEYLVLKKYLDTLIYFKNKTSGPINQLLVISIYTKLRGIELDVTSLNSYYRKEEVEEASSHVFMGKHYEGCPVSKIEESMSSLFEYLSSNSELSVLDGLITFYYILYIKPFDYFNEEVALILLKYVMAHEGQEEIPFIINFEFLLDDNFINKIKDKMLESELQLDLTYFIYEVLPYVEEKINIVLSSLEEYSSKDINSEVHSLPSEEERLINTEKFNVSKTLEDKYYENHRLSESQIEYEQKVSLPTMPIGLDESDASLVALHLLELYPTLRKSQAEFYAHHCTLGKYYSINQFKEFASCAYETARTSMDNLATLGFYKKENVKNKFVYTPVANLKGEK